MSLTFAFLTGADILPALQDVARLRITVFRDFPYLYDGTLEYEQDYLKAFAQAEGAIIVAALDRGRIVGASTGCKLSSQHEAFRQPFEASGQDVASIFYCAESVLLPEYRGQGAGKRFFALRESHGRWLGCKCSVFCAVVRDAAHPARPAGYVPLDSFWRNLGYQPSPGMMTHYAWLDVGDTQETEKPMQFWMKQL